MSRFVSAGNIEPAKDQEDAWKKAQEAIDATKKKNEEAAAGSGLQEGGKTLYETLQANKAAKQDAFEESVRQRTQVQFLNEEDEEYLESLSKNEREQKAASAKEAREQLAAFRKQQDDAGKKATGSGQASSAIEERETWSIGSKKRKKGFQQDLIKGVKLRKTSSAGEDLAEARTTTSEGQGSPVPTAGVANKQAPERVFSSVTKESSKAASPTAGLGLGAYSSDEDD